MKIIIDGRSITPHMSGISRYTYELIKGYIKKYGSDNVFVILNSKIEPFSYNYLLCKYKRHSIIDNIFFSLWLSKQDYDIYHAGDLIGPFWHKKNVTHIVTCHDLMFAVLKDFFGDSTPKTKIHTYKMKLFFRFVLNASNSIISVSKTTQKDLLRIYNKDSIVIPEGINKFSSEKTVSAYKGLDKNSFFLYVGLGSPHKNIDFLVNAFLKSKTSKKLIICGKGHKIIESDRIIYTGWISDESLDFLYRNCAAFIFPSKYEGFGLPILEALSYHCRVFSSNAGSLNEFSSEYVYFFDPCKELQLIDLIEKCDDISIDKEGIDSYLDNFKWENIWDNFHSEYNEFK